MKIISKKENEYIIDLFKANYPDIEFVYFSNDIYKIFEPNTVVNSDTISYNPVDKLNIKRNTKKILILTDDDSINNAELKKIEEILRKVFLVYIEIASDLKKYTEKNMIDTFEFRNYLDSLLKKYLDVDYLYLFLREP